MLESDKDPQAAIDECLNSSWRFEILRFFLNKGTFIFMYNYLKVIKNITKYS